MTTTAAECVLCVQDGGALIWRGEKLRLIRAVEEGFPAFYRVIWNAHAAELSDLSDDDRNLCMRAVAAVERVMRDTLAPTKINLAALGNMVPHLHWHVIPRYTDDRHFPEPVWGQAQRPGVAHPSADAVALARAIDGALSAGH